jgi:hypothetical protein
MQWHAECLLLLLLLLIRERSHTLQITPYRAGHVLGAAMFMVEVAGLRCLYTGDYSRLPDRHLPAADIPPISPHIGGHWAPLFGWLGVALRMHRESAVLRTAHWHKGSSCVNEARQGTPPCGPKHTCTARHTGR